MSGQNRAGKWDVAEFDDLCSYGRRCRQEMRRNYRKRREGAPKAEKQREADCCKPQGALRRYGRHGITLRSRNAKPTVSKAPRTVTQIIPAAIIAEFKSRSPMIMMCPRPDVEPTSSAATSAIQQTWREMRKPVKIIGSALGIT